MLIYDTCKISTREITDEGFLRVDALAGRVGVQTYYPGDSVYDQRPKELQNASKIRLLRPAAEVMDSRSLESFRHKSVTIEHPPEMVTAANVKKYQAGFVVDIYADSTDARARLLLQDSDAIRMTEAGKTEVSLGYTTDIIWGGGTDDLFGLYDGIMTKIRGNHLAIVDRARAGREYRLLDAAGNTEETNMSTELTDALTENGKMHAEITDAKSVIETQKSQIADLEMDKASLAADLEETKKQVVSDSELEKLIADGVKERAAVVDSAREVMPKIEVEGKTNTEIQLEVIDHLTGGKSKPDAKNATLVTSVYDALSTMPRSKTEEINDALSGAKKSDVTDSDSARAKMIARRKGESK